MAHTATCKRPRLVDDGAESGSSPKRPKRRMPDRNKAAKPRADAKLKLSLSTRNGSAVERNLLARYYPRVETLRAHLLTRLPATSRIRRKRLASVGNGASPNALEQQLSHILDTTLVACHADGHNLGNASSGTDACRNERQSLRQAFSQSRLADDSNVTISNAAQGAFSPQAEIVDFVVWLLFERSKSVSSFNRTGAFPPNVLCHGFQRGSGPGFRNPTIAAYMKPDAYPPCTIPGLYAARPPQNAQGLKDTPWPQLLALLGASGETIMTDLLLDCSMFLSVDAGQGNYLQLTGRPLFELLAAESAGVPQTQTHCTAPVERHLSDVSLVRCRMFYARPSFNKHGSICFGLIHIHVLNRFPFYTKLPNNAPQGQTLASQNRAGTVQVAMYIFPRQFGLHNVFTSSVDRTTTAHKFQDYTLRETEIIAKFGDPKQGAKIPIPKRLRGAPLALVEKMRKLHGRCSYHALFEHYCPVMAPSQAALTTRRRDVAGTTALPPGVMARPSPETDTISHEARPKPEREPHDAAAQGDSGTTTPIVRLATPLALVSAFCQAAIQRVVPDDFWGIHDVRRHNKTVLLKSVDTFVRLLRYETLSLHGLLQDLKISELAWLAPPGLQGRKMSKTDAQKRRDIFAEFVYYLFDSFLVPLICSHFYVTESNTHRNQLFYFRHDVWQSISEPALISIKAKRFQEVEATEANRILDSRGFSYGRIRLVPKQGGMRTITNLCLRRSKNDGSRLRSSMNMILAPVASMFNLERREHPERLGSAILSTSSIYGRLKQFKQSMAAQNRTPPVFYFAMVDVKSAFDTIPQEAMIKVLGSVPTHPVYCMDKHVEIYAPGREVRSGLAMAPKPIRSWKMLAKGNSDASGFHDVVEADYARLKRNNVFVDTAFRQIRDAESLAVLAATHIEQNIVKIGCKFYRQRNGIPQGSVLSSILCSYFYADLEEKQLGFLKHPSGHDGSGDDNPDINSNKNRNNSLMLRLIDDFLLVTTDRSKAVRFVEVMQRGLPEYGVTVNPSKSLVNFDLEIGGKAVPRIAPGASFPYCGRFIHCSTLDLIKDCETKQHGMFNSLTVDRTRLLGYNFKRKIFHAFKIQAQQMFFDTTLNSRPTVLHNLHGAFVETAQKMWAYARCMPRAARPRAQLVIDTIEELSTIAYRTLNGETSRMECPDYRFSVSRPHCRYILLHAFLVVLARKQASYGNVIVWLRTEMRQLRQQHLGRIPSHKDPL